MLAEPMSFEKAREIAEAIRRGRIRHGAQFSPPYRPYEIVEACAVLGKHINVLVGELQLHVPKDELTQANRRLAACEARVAKLAKKYDKNPEE
jgi:hypothetical protein